MLVQNLKNKKHNVTQFALQKSYNMLDHIQICKTSRSETWLSYCQSLSQENQNTISRKYLHF